MEAIPNTPMRFLWYVSYEHKKYLYMGLVAVTCAEIFGTSIPFVFKSLVDTAHKVIEGTADVETVWIWAFVYPLLVALVSISWRVSGFIGMEWAARSNSTSYKALFGYLAHHSHTYFSDRFAGSLSSKVSHASEGVQSIAEAFLWNYVPTILGFIFTIILLGITNLSAAILFTALIAILIPLNIYLAKYRNPYVVEFSTQATRARGNAVDAITNMSAIRQFARVEDEQERHAEHIDMMRDLNIRQWRISEWGLSLNNLLIVIFEACILLLSIRAWTQSTISIGDLVMITALLANMQSTLVFIGSSMNGFIRRYGEIQEGLADIVVEHDIVDIEGAKVLSAPKGQIEWKNVNFGYEGSVVFADFNLSIKAGERIGLVGSSGAGKTTFVSLLLRQHDLIDGSIVIDSQNIKDVTQDSLRETIAVVPQEPLLFHRSIKENIIYGKPDATDAEVFAVAKKAFAHEFIMELTEGYDTLVGERGVKLSGGQKQRIAIARAMLKDARILVLDEATSALDSESEVVIQKALHKLMKGKTVIAIAHRLSTLREMDRIIVLENGKIVEDGTHDTLAKAKGTYARLWKHQAGGFLQD